MIGANSDTGQELELRAQELELRAKELELRAKESQSSRSRAVHPR
jgi:hypothetical protein